MSKTKKFFSAIIMTTTILWSMGMPSLVAALSVTNITVSTTSAEITFDGPTLNENSPSSTTELGNATNYATDLRNYVLKTGDSLTTRNLSRFDPYNMTTQYLQAGENDYRMRIYGLKNLQLTEGQAWDATVQNIKNSGETQTVTTYNTNNTVVASVDPIINYMTNTQTGDDCNGWPCGNIGDEVTISGSNFATSTDVIQVLWRYGEGSSATSTVSSVNATTLITTVPAEVNGETTVNITNLTPNRSSDFRSFIVWNPATQAMMVGSVTSTTVTDIDGVNVRAFQPGQMGAPLQFETHSNGKYALISPATSSYNIEFITPAGATKAAPAKVSGQVATVGSMTTVSEQSFLAATLGGTVKDSNGTVLMEGVEVVAHSADWTIAQRAKTGSNGVWKVYVPNTSSFQCYTIEAEPRDYHSQKLGYQKGASSKCLTLDEISTNNTVNLTTANVTGTIKTPAGTSSEANPTPDTAVPNAGVGLHTPDWSYQQWANTDSSGNFTFGGATAGTNYVLEIESPYSGNFAGYARTTIQGLTVNASGVTNLNNDAQAVSGALRFSLPNVFGSARCGGVDEAYASVELQKDGAWYGSSSDSSGKFKFGGVLIGTYTLRIQPVAGSSCATTSFSVSITSATSNDLGVKSLSTPNVSGSIKDPTGATGQANVWLNLCPYQNPGQCYGAQTQQNGSFSLNAPDGTWRLEVNQAWGSIYAAPSGIVVTVAGTTVSEYLDPSNALSIANNQLTILMLDPSVDGLIGRVCLPGTSDANCADANQAVGVSNVGINLRIPNQMGGDQQWTQTDINGYYAFGGIAAGSYEVEANPYSGCGVTACARKVTSITITSSQSSRTKNIILTAPNITGTVYRSATDLTPVPNAWVSLRIEGPMQGPGGWYGANTNQSGEFSFGGVVAGNYVLEIEPPRWGSEEEQAAYRQYATRKYAGIEISQAVADGQALDIGTTYGTNGKLYLGVPQVIGRVMNPGPDGVAGNADDAAVAWSWIMVHDQMWQNQGGGSTDDQGYFRVGGLDADSTGLSIEINLPWGGTQAYIQPSGLTVDIASNVGAIKRNGNALNNNLITLTSPTKTLTGTVTKKTGGAVIANAKVEANREMGGGHFETTTDANGAYTLKLSGGGWWVMVRPDWNLAQPDWVYADSPKRVSFVEDDSIEPSSQNFEVETCDAIITGLVKDPTGATAVANAWVNASRGMGMGNGGTTDSNGRFNFKVPAGVYELVANPNWGEQGANYAASTPIKIKAIAEQTTDAGTLSLKSKSSHIKGTITDTAGNPVGNVMINAWQRTGFGWASGMSNSSTGRFDLQVSSGDWGLMAMPMSSQYVYQGGPQQITIADSQTSDDNDFLLKLADGLLKVKITDAAGNKISDIWGGVWVRDTSAGGDFLDFGKPEMMDGMESAGGGTGGGSAVGGAMGGGMDKGGFAGGGLMNGYTEIKVPLGSYELGIYAPPGSKYTLTATQTITVGSSDLCGTTTKCKEIDLVVAPNNATIKGKFYIDTNSNGSYDAGTDTVVTGVRAFINGTKDGGGWTMTEFAPSSSSDLYELKVAPGTWYVDAFIDPMMSFSSNKYKVVAADVGTSLAADTIETRNFELKKLDKTISGTVKDPDGVGMGGVWVFVDYGNSATMNQFKGPGGLGVGTFTDSSGAYTLNVTAGSYKIGVGIPPWDSRDLINPDMQSVTVASVNMTGVDLQFTQSDATITGSILLSGSKNKGMVNAWSDSKGTGAFSTNGDYTLKVKSGDTWHIQASASVNNILYQSVVTDIVIAAGANSDNNLTLVSTSVAVPDAKTTTFSASDSKIIELSNGLKLDIPSGALASSGTVTVTITPTVDIEETKVKADTKDKPIGVNYDFTAKNSTGQEITSFNNDVKIVFPYTEALIAAAGYTENDVMPKYFDDTTNTWETYKSAVVDTVNNTITVTTNHFTAGGLTGGQFTMSGTSTSGTSTTGSTGGSGSAGLVGPTNISVNINSGAAKTSTRSVTLNLAASGAMEMIISNHSDFSGANWESFVFTKAWSLSSGNGEKTVYIKFRDILNNSSSIVSGVINLDEIIIPIEVLKEKSVVKAVGSSALYLILGGKRHVFPHIAVYNSWGYPKDFSTVKAVAQNVLEQYAEGDPVPFRDGSIFRGTTQSLYGKSASAVYVVSDGKLMPVKSSAVYQALYKDPKWKLVTWVPDDLLNKFAYPLGETIESTNVHPNGVLIKYADSATIYLIVDGKKRGFTSKSTLAANGYKDRTVITIPKTEIYESAESISALADELTTPLLAAK